MRGAARRVIRAGWLLSALTVAAAAAAPPALPATPGPSSRASLTDIEGEVMCVSCRESLALAQSPQALAERNFIRRLIAQGQTKQQIEQALVAQYGTAVLGRPPAQGFNLTVYVVPPALLLAGLLTLVLALPRWRRRTRAAATRRPAAPPRLSPTDANRLDQDLARFDR